ncbi:MAG: hypothetical protein ACHQII_07765 [Bacteroidia bacterium]
MNTSLANVTIANIASENNTELLKQTEEKEIKQIREYYSKQTLIKGDKESGTRTESTIDNYINGYKNISFATTGIKWVPTSKMTVRNKAFTNLFVDYIKNEKQYVRGSKTYSIDTPTNRSYYSNCIFHVLIACLAIREKLKIKENATLKFWGNINKEFIIKKDDHLLRTKDELSQREIENLGNTTWNDVVAKRAEVKRDLDIYIGKEMSMKKNAAWNKYLLMCLYTMAVPTRGEDWYNARIFLDNDELKEFTDNSNSTVNHINLETKKLEVYEHKTVKTHGHKTVKLSDELVNILIEFKEDTDNTWLLQKFGTNHPDHWNHMNVNDAFRTIFGKKISVDLLKKLYIAHVSHNLPVEDRMIVAHDMGHSLSTSEINYSGAVNRANQNDDDDDEF